MVVLLFFRLLVSFFFHFNAVVSLEPSTDVLLLPPISLFFFLSLSLSLSFFRPSRPYPPCSLPQATWCAWAPAVRAIATPCHTRGSLCYQVQGSAGRATRSSRDTLFTGGCGAPFEGDAEEMYRFSASGRERTEDPAVSGPRVRRGAAARVLQGPERVVPLPGHPDDYAKLTNQYWRTHRTAATTCRRCRRCHGPRGDVLQRLLRGSTPPGHRGRRHAPAAHGLPRGRRPAPRGRRQPSALASAAPPAAGRGGQGGEAPVRPAEAEAAVVAAAAAAVGADDLLGDALPCPLDPRLVGDDAHDEAGDAAGTPRPVRAPPAQYGNRNNGSSSPAPSSSSSSSSSSVSATLNPALTQALPRSWRRSSHRVAAAAAVTAGAATIRSAALRAERKTTRVRAGGAAEDGSGSSSRRRRRKQRRG